MEPNVNVYTIVLFVHAVLLAVSQIESLPAPWPQVLVVALAVVDAALAVFFRTTPGKAAARRVLMK